MKQNKEFYAYEAEIRNKDFEKDFEEVDDKEVRMLLSEVLDEAEETDSSNIYFKQIGVIPLLNAEEERKLAEKMSAGDMKAKKKLIESNLRLAAAFAKKYQGRGLEFQDLLQEANLGLMKGIERFDVTKGFKLSTYVAYWIKQSITRAISDKGRTIRLPAHMAEKVGKAQKMQKQLTQEFGHEPTAEELAEAMGLSKGKVRELLAYMQNTVSLNATVEDGDSEIADFTEDTTIPSPQQQMEEKDLVRVCGMAVNTLTEKEQKVIRLRFGFEGSEMTLDEVSEVIELSRERVRTIEKKAIQKLRTPATISLLRDFYNGDGVFRAV